MNSHCRKTAKSGRLHFRSSQIADENRRTLKSRLTKSPQPFCGAAPLRLRSRTTSRRDFVP
jgi:hypothetical protein